MSTKVTKECLLCQQPFEATLSELKRGKAKFCSRSHASRYNVNRYYIEKNKPNVQCAYCDKSFYKNQSKQRMSRSGLFFCCRAHKDLANRLDGIAAIHPSHFGNGNGSYRELALRSLPHCCNRCSYDKLVDVLVVHHTDCDRSNNKLENLEILCRNCHWEHHLGTN